MTKALTQEQFVEKAKSIHGDVYDYSKTKYVKSNTKIIVSCIKEGHGDWEVTPNNHLKRKCPKCACSFTNAKDTFIPKAIEIYGDIYDYSYVDYVGSTTKVKIRCRKHEFFYVTPSNHLNGSGCAKCSYEKMSKQKVKSQEQFVEEAKAVHGDKYGLAKVEYTDCRQKVIIECFEHGDFLTQANSFLRGHGCPSCMEGGYNQMLPGTLYVMTCGDVTKVGITNKTSAQRANHIGKTTHLKFETAFAVMFQDGSEPLKIETHLLRDLRKTHKRVEDKFNGSTECFYGVDVSALIYQIKQITTGVIKCP